MINLSEVGAFPSSSSGVFRIQFGVYLPGIRGADGFEVVARVIHTADRYDPSIPTVDFPLTWNSGHPLDLWSVDANIAPKAGSSFGTEGIYLYRFQLAWTPPGGSRKVITRWFTDPFARRTDVGRLGAVQLS